MKYLYACICVFLTTVSFSQDSLRTENLSEVTIRGDRPDLDRLPAIDGTRIWSGKKNEVISLRTLDANITEKTARQIFAKVPGVFVYDMDGTGNQVNISTRGLDPHRGWEFNIRRDDAITNSDMYGYPASHYSMPMEAVDRIQMVRGTGSLQYGAQFGGLLNYITKTGDTTRRVAFESINSAGSFGLITTYNAIGGRIGKIDYYGYVNKRNSAGYRDNGRTESDAEAITLKYNISPKLSVKAEFSHSKYVYQLPGQLTDSMFQADPRQSTRSRNYYSPDIYVPSVHLDWKIGDHTRLTWITSAVLGSRSSVMFDKPATTKDAIDPVTLQYAARQVDIDNYHSYTNEVRVLHDYKFLNSRSALVVGFQVMRNDMRRRQLGVGTTGTDYDLTLTKPDFGRDLHYKTNNIAVFAENNFAITDRLSVTPGIRAEMGKTDLSGTISYYDNTEISNSIDHKFVLAGINAQYILSKYQNLYIGWAQAYRPVIMKDIIPSSTYERVDKNLKDAQGYNFEVGYRGSSKYFRWDVSYFQLRYDNRLGMLSQQDPDGTLYLLRTNIGNSITNGAELYVEYFVPLRVATISVFTSTSIMDAKYKDASVRVGDANRDVSNNRIESVPDVISRNGLNVKFGKASLSFLYSYVGSTFADALNTVAPSVSGSVGQVPSYGLLDINASYKVSEHIVLRLNVNNVADTQYFTKRPLFYPGPGVWPSDGRSIVGAIGINL